MILHDSAPGSDNIHYQVLKRLPDQSLEVWLHIFNKICDTSTFPDSWRGNCYSSAQACKRWYWSYYYRPIALTICVCKTMARIKESLTVPWIIYSYYGYTLSMWVQEKKPHCTWPLGQVGNIYLRGFYKKTCGMCGFFYLEKAYDTAWKYGIMRDLHEIGNSGKVPQVYWELPKW